MAEQWPVHYGDHFVGGEIADRTTSHGSGTIDIQVDPATGQVVAVWFRCLTLPFTVSLVDRPVPVSQPPLRITAVEYLES